MANNFTCLNCYKFEITTTSVGDAMEFIELSGSELMDLLNDGEYQPDDLRRAGVTEESRVRINRQGDMEVHKGDRWEVIGGLLGDFAQRIEKKTGREWKTQDS